MLATHGSVGPRSQSEARVKFDGDTKKHTKHKGTGALISALVSWSMSMGTETGESSELAGLHWLKLCQAQAQDKALLCDE